MTSDIIIAEAYYSAANPAPGKEEGIDESQINELSGKGQAWINQVAKATAKNTKEGDKACQLIEDWIVTNPRSYKGMPPLMKALMMGIFEANEYIPMEAEEKLKDMGISF